MRLPIPPPQPRRHRESNTDSHTTGQISNLLEYRYPMSAWWRFSTLQPRVFSPEHGELESPQPPQHCMSVPCRHSVFIRTLPSYLTLPLRQTLFCHGKERKPNEFTEHHRAWSWPRLTLRTLWSFPPSVGIPRTANALHYSTLFNAIPMVANHPRCHGRL